MKRILITICIICLLTPVILCAEREEPAGQFFITKVNRTEKLYVIPPERRDFMGSRGLQKFDYQRIIPSEERGEEYSVTFRYCGARLKTPLRLKFEFRYAIDQKDLHAKKYVYRNLKKNDYTWLFFNVGADYIEKGKVDRWKVSLILGGKTVAEKRSSTWFAMEGT